MSAVVEIAILSQDFQAVGTSVIAVCVGLQRRGSPSHNVQTRLAVLPNH
jgi:hypothetical protein